MLEQPSVADKSISRLFLKLQHFMSFSAPTQVAPLLAMFKVNRFRDNLILTKHPHLSELFLILTGMDP